MPGPGHPIHVILRPKDLGPQLQPEYIVDSFPATMGRHSTNDVELPFDSVSRFHARLEIHGAKVRVVDLHSSNGTHVNGKRVQVAPLMDQDVISLGGIDLIFTQHKGHSARELSEDPASETSVHFVDRDQPMVQEIVDADIPDEGSSSHRFDEPITDSDQLRKARERLATFYRLHEILRSTTEEKKLLRRTLRLLMKSLPIDLGVVLTRDSNDRTLFNPVAIQVKSARQIEKDSIGISKTILTRALKEKVAILTKDARNDERFNESESILARQVRSVMCVPLISYHHVFGFIHLEASESVRAFTKDDLAFVTNIGVEVAIHLHNLRMLREKIVTERMAAIGQTITGLAHNIKNVLHLSRGGMDLMEKRLAEKSYDSLSETWTLVKRGTDRINAMVQDMLDYSRARSVEKSRCSVNELLTEIRETFAEEMARRGVACELELDEKCPPVMIDADGLDKALVNLLMNAAEASPEGAGRIVLRSLYRPDGSIALEVEDNGGGIPNEVLPRIFFPFFTTKGSRGNGLGLAMTKKFVEDMNGRIEVKSEEGHGTTFTITLFAEKGDVRLDGPTPAPRTSSA